MAEINNTATITITVTSDGDFTYNPAVKRLRKGQTITWQCLQGPFSISFKDATPFDNIDYQSEEKGGQEWSITTCAAIAIGGPGHFHYTVAIYVPALGRVYQDSACPEIIIS